MEVMRHVLAATAILAVMMMCAVAVFVTAYALFFKRGDGEGDETDD